MAPGGRQHQRCVPVDVRTVHIQTNRCAPGKFSDGSLHLVLGAVFACRENVRHVASVQRSGRKIGQQWPVEDTGRQGNDNHEPMVFPVVLHILPKTITHPQKHHQRKEDDLSRMFDGQPARDQLGSSPFVGCIGEGKDVGEYTGTAAQDAHKPSGLSTPEDGHDESGEAEIRQQNAPPQPPFLFLSGGDHERHEHAHARGHLTSAEEHVNRLVGPAAHALGNSPRGAVV
mmetsp:Transcript_858/g.1674  ORF Transcript_858/g.1674 Transcript_858/m.1674 type:complete len:229 (-) Transcript_858:132-818(-)